METILDVLDSSVGLFPDNTALVIKPGFRQDRWSYRRLDAFAGRVARYLQSHGIQRGDRVIVWAPNRPEWVGAYFGVLCAGAVVVPLDVRSTPEFVRRVAEQVDAKLMIRGRQGMPLQVDTSISTIYVEDLDRLATADPDSRSEVRGSDLAQIMFTSGTTGDPKGVMLTHFNIASNVISTRPVFEVTPHHRVLSLLPLSHMFEITGGLLALLFGGAQIAYPVSRQPSVIFKTMQEHHVTSLVVVPQVLALFMDGIEREVAKRGREKLWARLNKLAERLPMQGRRLLFRSVHRRFGGALREIISGGAYLDPELAVKWERLGITIQQGYGATEASPVITFNRVDNRRFDSVGTVMPGEEIRIAPDGEVLVKGPNITPGYWRNPEATAAVLKNGWYHTGDLGEIGAGGHLFLKGRKKDLIVLANGQNVYPDDIENVLRRDPRVKDAVVLGMQQAGHVDVSAVLLLAEPADVRRIIDDANRRLADHQQIAAAFVWPEDDFPRTNTLKIRKGLVLDWVQRQESGAPQPEQQVTMADDIPQLFKLVAELAGRPATTIHPEQTLGGDLGLDSLGRVELLSFVDQEMGVFVDESLLSPGTTVGDLQKLVQQGESVTVRLRSYRWAQVFMVRMLREASFAGIIFPLLSALYRLDVRGKELVQGIDGPVLLVANHCLHLDNPLILKALPSGLRRRTAIAAAADDIFGNRIRGALAALLGNAFPFAREGSIRSSLERLGELLDDGYSVLLYPEGKLTVGGPMQPFKSGAGLIATESRTPVVPIRFEIIRFGAAEGRIWPPRAHVVVSFGKPIKFEPGESPLEATDRLEDAVRELGVSRELIGETAV